MLAVGGRRYFESQVCDPYLLLLWYCFCGEEGENGGKGLVSDLDEGGWMADYKGFSSIGSSAENSPQAGEVSSSSRLWL